MSKKHTPGPWQVKEGYDKDSGLKLHRVVFGTSIVAECYGINSNANARLISAAPELLSLLNEARSTLEMWKDVAPAVSLCADIDAAIAKATGE